MQSHRQHRPNDVSSVRFDWRYFKIIRQLPEDFGGQAAIARLAYADGSRQCHHDADVEIDPAANPAIADVRRDGGSRHRVGKKYLHHGPGRRCHDIGDGLTHIGVGPQEITRTAVIPRIRVDCGCDRPGLEHEELIASATPLNIYRVFEHILDRDRELNEPRYLRVTQRRGVLPVLGYRQRSHAAIDQPGHDHFGVDHSAHDPTGGPLYRDRVRRHLSADNRLPKPPGSIDFDH